jgi:hypothetical protein
VRGIADIEIGICMFMIVILSEAARRAAPLVERSLPSHGIERKCRLARIAIAAR